MMCIYSVFGMSHSRATISFWAIAKLRCTLPALLSHMFERTNKPILADWFDCWLYKGSAVWISKKTSGTLDHHLSKGLAFLNGFRLGSATSTRVTPCCSTHWGWIKSSQSKWELGRVRVNCSDPHEEARPHLPEKTLPEKRPYQQDANRVTGREVPLRGFDWQAKQHFVLYLTGTQAELFQEVYFQRELVASQISWQVLQSESEM